MWGEESRRLPGRPRPNSEVDEELEFHLTMRTEELEAKGLPRDKARKQAEEEFGDMEATRDYCRAQDRLRRRRRRISVPFRLVRDELVLAVRTLRRRPGSVIAPTAILAVAVALNALVFSVVRGVLLSPLPFRDSDRMVVVEEISENGGFVGASYPVLDAWRQDARHVEALGGYISTTLPMMEEGGAVHVEGAAVTQGFFQLLDHPFRIGSPFTVEEHAPGGPPVVAISEGLWKRAFGSDRDILGRLLDLNGEQYEVVSVVRDDRVFPDGSEIWIPVERHAPQLMEVAGATIFVGLGRLAPGMDLSGTSRELAEISARVPGGTPEAVAVRLQDRLLEDVRTPLLFLQGAVLLVLLAASANAGSLLLARGVRRRGEVALRASLGAGSARVVVGLLMEGLLLGGAAGLAGLLLARISLHPALALVPMDLPRAQQIALDPTVALVALVLAAGTGVATALIPALTGSRTSPSETLRESSQQGGTPLWIRRALEGFVVTQVALALVLTAGAGLLVRSLILTLQEDPGFNPAGITLVDLSLPAYRYPDEAARIAFARELLERASALSVAQGTALGRNLPISGTNMTSPLLVDGSTGQTRAVQIAWVTQGYFNVMGIPILDGRGFDDADRLGAPFVMAVDPGVQTAEGPQLSVGDRAHSFFGGQEFREVVGVVGPVRHAGLRVSPVPMVYEPFFQQAEAQGFTLLIRSDAPAGVVARRARELVRGLDPELAVDQMTTMDSRIRRSLAEPRFYTVALSAFGILAVLLALAGCQAGLAHRVAARRREIGIRVALGARTASVRGMVLRRGLFLTILGMAVGLVVAIPGSRLLTSQLYGVTPGDPLTYGALLLLLLGAGVLASDLPARQAAALDPADVLREG
jgi:putative ABC transport system permease protein